MKAKSNSKSGDFLREVFKPPLFVLRSANLSGSPREEIHSRFEQIKLEFRTDPWDKSEDATMI